jgi:ubiquinone/menaquinone biosynthesis C-methylase UbiE
MSENITTFNGSVPQNYDDYLGPLLFESFAIDLTSRIVPEKKVRVLELACGTGRLTRHLLTQLPPGSELVATDLNTDMIAVAKEKIEAPNLRWDVVDMLNIPYENESFDIVVCQFGIMLVPDHTTALNEINRVLRKNGKIWFSVWGDINENGIWKIGADTIKSFLALDPIRQTPGPFSMQDEKLLTNLVEQSGFTSIKVDHVHKTGKIEKAELAARGFIQGLPVYMIIKQRNAELLEQIQQQLTDRLTKELGDAPMQTLLYTLIVNATK